MIRRLELSTRFALAAGLVAAIALLPALRNGFVWDDINNLVASHRLHDLENLLVVFRKPAMWSAGLPTGGVATYRPLALASFILDYRLYGLDARGFHASSIALHAINTALVVRLSTRLTGRPGDSFVLGLLFAVHPCVVEAVVWINGRSELFALAGGGAALCAAISGRRFAAIPCGVALFAALLGKESGIFFAPLAIAAAWRFRASANAGSASSPIRPSHRFPIDAALAATAAVAGYLLLRRAALADSPGAAGGDIVAAVRALPGAWVAAAQAALLPLDRSVGLIGPWIGELSFAEEAAFAAAALAVAGLVLALASRGAERAAFGLAWWLVSLLPLALLARLDWPGLYRWIYIGLPGLLLATHAAIAHLPARTRGAVGLGATALLLIATERAIPVWHDNVRLFGVMAEEQPDRPFPLQQLGLSLLHAGRPAEAARCLERALAVGARDPAVRYFLAVAWAALDRCDEAVAFAAETPPPLADPDQLPLAAGECYLRRGDAARARPFYVTCAPRIGACQDALAHLPSP